MSSERTRPWEKYDLSLYDWEYFDASRDRLWHKIAQDIKDRSNVQDYLLAHSEGAVEIIEAILKDEKLDWEAVNIPNLGGIHGLPDNSIVELPATVDSKGFATRKGYELPMGILSLLQQEVATSQLCIDSIVHADRQLAIQSLLLDPVVDDLDTAADIFEEILLAYKQFLPQFF